MSEEKKEALSWDRVVNGKPGLIRILESARDLLTMERDRLIEMQKTAMQLAMQEITDRQHRQETVRRDSGGVD